MSQQYFTFEIEGQHCGFFELDDRDGVLYQNACFTVDKERYENPFWLRYADNKVLAYKFADESYRDWSQPDDVVPSSALLLIARSMTDGESRELRLFNEGANVIAGKITVTRRVEDEQSVVSVMLEGRQHNRFFFNAAQELVRCEWGEMTQSVRVADRAAAVAGTDWA